MTSILEVENLYKYFYQNLKEYQVLNGINLSINKGEIYGFLGPNGSGKTTTLKCILGFLYPTSGKISIFGNNIFENHGVFNKIGYSPESAVFYDHLNGIEFLIFIGQLSGMSKNESELVGLGLLEKLGLTYAKNKRIKSYSKGMKQRLSLASSLINDPEFIFLDEPMSGLDPLGRILVKDLMVELNNKGKTVFFNTHILSDVEEIAHRFGIVFDGKMINENHTKNIDSSLEEFFKEQISNQEKQINIS